MTHLNNTVLIAIQARSTSTRLPRKHHEIIENKRLLDHVIDACLSARDYVNRQKREEVARVVLLVPTGDEIKQDFSRVPVFEGSEQDVLSRYAKACDYYKASHVVRITGDCPLIRPFVISKAINLGLKAGYDYLSNVDERCRTAPDGQDVEFMTARLLSDINKTASTPYHREHVTTYARENPPRWAKRGFIIDHFDYSSGEKISVDTEEDLARVRRVYSDIAGKMEKACIVYPKHCIHRL